MVRLLFVWVAQLYLSSANYKDLHHVNLPEKGYAFQASGIIKGRGFTCWRICYEVYVKSVISAHNLGPKGGLLVFYGCEKADKMFWFCDLFIFKAQDNAFQKAVKRDTKF